MIAQQRFGMADPQRTHMGRKSAAIELTAQPVQPGATQAQGAADVLRREGLGEMGRQICIQLGSGGILPEGRHALQDQVGRRGMQNPRSGTHIFLRDDGLHRAGIPQGRAVQRQRRTAALNGCDARIKIRVGKHMPAPQVAHQHLSHIQGHHRLRQASMAAVDVGASLLLGCGAGLPVTAKAGCLSGLRGTDGMAEGQKLLRPGDQLPHVRIEHGDPDAGDFVKVLQQASQGIHVKYGDHLPILQRFIIL